MLENKALFEMETVIHVEYGGFTIDTEMAVWLMENRGWSIKKEFENKDNNIFTCLIESTFADDYYHINMNSIQFRSHPDILDCVREIKKNHINDVYPDSLYGYIHNLKIVKLSFYAEIENYYDGKEKINCWTSLD